MFQIKITKIWAHEMKLICKNVVWKQPCLFVNEKKLNMHEFKRLIKLEMAFWPAVENKKRLDDFFRGKHSTDGFIFILSGFKIQLQFLTSLKYYQNKHFEFQVVTICIFPSTKLTYMINKHQFIICTSTNNKKEKRAL